MDLAVFVQSVQSHEVVHGYSAELAGDAPEIVSGADGIDDVSVGYRCTCIVAAGGTGNGRTFAVGVYSQALSDSDAGTDTVPSLDVADRYPVAECNVTEGLSALDAVNDTGGLGRYSLLDFLKGGRAEVYRILVCVDLVLVIYEGVGVLVGNCIPCSTS